MLRIKSPILYKRLKSIYEINLGIVDFKIYLQKRDYDFFIT